VLPRVTIDISPGRYGNNPLGTNDGTGHPVNPVTGQPYAPNVVPRGDFARVLAEFWADGPKSETPPGHWNTLANHVTDHPMFRRCGRAPARPARRARVGREGLPRAQRRRARRRDRRVGHQARPPGASRPITLIRYMAARGQSSDPRGRHRTTPTACRWSRAHRADHRGERAPGERHAHLARFVGEIAVRGWRGEPGDRATEVGGVGWIRARSTGSRTSGAPS
jgi:hypothetical protein